MKYISILVLTVICSITLAVPVKDNQTKIVDKENLLKQKDLLRLFKYVLQPSVYKDQAEIAKNYNLKDNLKRASNEEVATTFLKLYKAGLLPRGEVFSIFNDKHREQAVALFDVLYFAKDWDTFYKTACWAREYVNEGMFVYAMHVAVFHRQDTVVLPPIYEIYPHFFVNGQVFDKAYTYKLNADNDKQKTYYIEANYTSLYRTGRTEQNDLAYIYEDVRSAASYYYFHITYPFWMSSDKYGLNEGIRGELFYFFHQQILARYYMERLANGYGTVDVYSWQWPLETGYTSNLRYSNGVAFPSRPTGVHLVDNPHKLASSATGKHNLFKIQQIEDYEGRLRTAIDFGYILTLDEQRKSIYRDNGFNVLANLAECNADSENPRYFGPLQKLARQVLGYSSPPVNSRRILPSVLEHYETSLRDPVFYEFFNRIVHYLAKYKDVLPEYNRTELECAGVQIEDVTMSKLNTIFEKFEFEISNGLYAGKADDVHIWARQYHLNHKPFQYRVRVRSDEATNVVVRAFIGPKYDDQGNGIPLNDNRLNFVEFDKFAYSLEQGENVIERNSEQDKSANVLNSFQSLYDSVLAALNGDVELKPTLPELHKGFVMPKGNREGRVFQFFFFISPQTTTAGISDNKIDNLSLGYPLDRQISDKDSFLVSNSYMLEEKVYHTEN